MTQVSLLDPDPPEYVPPQALVDFLVGYFARGRKLKEAERKMLERIAVDALVRAETALLVARRAEV